MSGLASYVTKSPMWWVGLLASVILIGYSAIHWGSDAYSYQGKDSIFLAIFGGGVGIVIGLLGSVVVLLVTAVYVVLGPLFAIASILSLVASVSNPGDMTFHMSFWCDITKAIGWHNAFFEWICALLTIVGWAPWLGLADG